MEEKVSAADRERRGIGEGTTDATRWERRLQTLAVAVASIGLGYLFFTNLWWMLPPGFGCSKDFQLEGENASGLCFWVGTLSGEPRTVLTSNLSSAPLGVPLGWVAQANGVFVDDFVEPNIASLAYVIWGTVALVSLSLILGVFSRLGALLATVVALELAIGLAGVSSPRGWEWSFPLMLLLSLALFALAPGRYFGLDRLLRPRFQAMRDRGSRFGRLLLAFT